MNFSNIIGGLGIDDDISSYIWQCHHCGKLVQPLESMVGKRIWRKMRDHCDCPKSLAEYQAILDKRKADAKIAQGLELLKSSGIDSEIVDCFDNFNPSSHNLLDGHYVFERVRNYCDTIDLKGKNFLVLSGKYGAGKTHLGIAALRYLITERLWKGRYIVWPALLKLARDSMSNSAKKVILDEIWDRLRVAQIVLIDDLDKGTPSSWVMEQLFEIIDYRYIRKRPTIVTANRDPYEMLTFWKSCKPDRPDEQSAIGDHAEAVIDRIMGQMWDNVQIEITQSYRTI